MIATLKDAPNSPRDTSDDANQPPSWPRPRTPIPPHRLAKLVNALGISAPVPLSQESNDSTPSFASLLSKPFTSEARRSPTPSVASTPQLTPHSPAPSFQSKFLLHVVPPLHIPHCFDSSESFQLTPPPAAASGYHTQFRRGTLVPLYPTLQSQLCAIAKEYALPSTTGIILYLVSSASSPNSEEGLNVPDEPGPRLSEDIWKHLWARVTKFEVETYSRLTTPTTAGFPLGYGGRSSPLFPQDLSSSPNSLRPLISPGRITLQSFVRPPTPTGSTASSTPSSQVPFSETSHSEVNTPDTSVPSDSRAATFDLPGLTSPSVIPILAKVEFDIDKRKAAWYEPWIRSRKLNYQKREQRGRTRSDSGTLAATEDDCGGGSEAEVLKVAPLPLRLVDRRAIPRFLLSADGEDDNHEADYVRLSESPADLEDTPCTVGDHDPLTDVFGPDGDTWADVRSNNIDQPEPEINPNIVDLALDGHALSEPAKTEGEPVNGSDEEEVQALWESRERPKLALDIPSSPPDPTGRTTTVGIVTAGTFRKAAPPPLIIVPDPFDPITSAEPSPLPTSGSAGLAYLRDRLPTSSEEDLNGITGMRRLSTTSRTKNKTPPAGDKRTGTLFEELDSCLEFEDTGEFDENDPNDRRRSQYALKAKLDEIEKALAQLSPRQLQHEIKPQERPMKSPPQSSSSVHGLSPGSAQSSSSSPASASRRGPPEQSVNGHANRPGAVWPTVPYSSLQQQDDEGETSLDLDDFPPPPKFALNGVSNAIPVSPYKKSFSMSVDTESEESKARRRDINSEEPTYPVVVPPSLRIPASSNSPIIPLSPDPFGRFPSLPSTSSLLASEALSSVEVPLPQAKTTYSTFDIPTERHSALDLLGRNSNSVVSQTDVTSPPPSSRFSIDSSDEGGNNRTSASLNPVKSIKSLWRKTRKASISSGPGSASASQTGIPQSPLPVASYSGSSTPRSLGPSNSSRESIASVALPPGRHSSRESIASMVLPPGRHPSNPLYRNAPLMPMSRGVQQSHSSSSINTMVFNQDSPYPILVSVPHPSKSRPRAASQATHALHPTSSTHRLLPDSERPTSLADADAMPSPIASVTDREKMGAPKSILKTRRADHSTAPLPPEQYTMWTGRSRVDPVVARPSAGGGQTATTPPPSLEPPRLSPKTSRSWSNRGPTHPRQSPDEEEFTIVDPVPRLELGHI
ncbi:hypothetical protein BJV78DRAFT_1277817 [Lactifluus subvellereus]|nr:hypothetical protein BJV78DRAFT_1277817 [Lactifluus subvellereus]